MRQIINLNAKWSFTKLADTCPAAIDPRWDVISLPHTWNAVDGQDGGGDFYRGVGWYAKSLSKADLPQAERYYLELRGANSSADVYWNGEKVAHHDGGYSTWRVDVTAHMADDNLIAAAVDNSPNNHVYPQFADFTFYGGLYRDVNLICVSESHFDLDFHGGPAIRTAGGSATRCSRSTIKRTWTSSARWAPPPSGWPTISTTSISTICATSGAW